MNALTIISAIVSLFISDVAVKAGSDFRESKSASNPLTYNLSEATADWITALENNETAHIMIVGDSISFKLDSYNWHLRNLMWDRFGWGGEGYFGLGSGFSGASPQSPNYGKEGPRFPQALRIFDPSPNDGIGGALYETGYVQHSSSSSPRDPQKGIYSPDGFWLTISDSAAYVDIDHFGSSATLFYLKQPGGGTMRLTFGGVWLADIDTNSVNFELGTFSYATEVADNNNSSVSTLRIETLDSAIQVNGIYMESENNGYRYTRCARGGQGPADFIMSNTQSSADTLAILNPDLVVIMLDWSNHYYEPGNSSNNEQFWYQRDLELLLDFYESSLPNSEFILVTHHNFNSNISIEADIMFDVAQQRGHGYINLFDLHASPSELHSLGFLVDNVHFTSEGGEWFGDYMFDTLVPYSPCYGDINGDGETDTNDIVDALREGSYSLLYKIINNFGCQKALNSINRLSQ